MLTTASDIPVEFCFVPGSESDVQALKKLPLTVVAEVIYAESAYTDYQAQEEPWIRFLKEHRRRE